MELIEDLLLPFIDYIHFYELRNLIKMNNEFNNLVKIVGESHSKEIEHFKITTTKIGYSIEHGWYTYLFIAKNKEYYFYYIQACIRLNS